jgi:hypothetical protein
VVVSSGQFLLDVESRTNEAIDKLRSGKAEEVPPLAATSAEGSELFIAHCEMTNADWLQADETIDNPYLGPLMSTCGSVARTVARPDKSTPLAGLVDAYLRTSKLLAADQFDGLALAGVKTAADRVTGDKYATLREAARQLSCSDTVPVARIRFKWLGDELAQILPPMKP